MHNDHQTETKNGDSHIHRSSPLAPPGPGHTPAQVRSKFLKLTGSSTNESLALSGGTELLK